MPRSRGMRQYVSRSAGRSRAPDPIEEFVSRLPTLRRGGEGELRGKAGPRKALPEHKGTAEGVARVQLKKKRRK